MATLPRPPSLSTGNLGQPRKINSPPLPVHVGSVRCRVARCWGVGGVMLGGCRLFRLRQVELKHARPAKSVRHFPRAVARAARPAAPPLPLLGARVASRRHGLGQPIRARREVGRAEKSRGLVAGAESPRERASLDATRPRLTVGLSLIECPCLRPEKPDASKHRRFPARPPPPVSRAFSFA